MKHIAEILLRTKAVTINSKNPYTFASGIRSPIYCDNRSIAGYVKERKVIVNTLVDVLRGLKFYVIAGTSTAGIQWAAWVADKLDMPMAYVRGSKKKHGKGKQIEGATVAGRNVVVIEDLISTGGSSYDAVEAVRENGGLVNDVVAIFTYQFEKAQVLFNEGKCRVTTLTNFNELVELAGTSGYLDKEKQDQVLEWNKDPTGWGPKYGYTIGKK